MHKFLTLLSLAMCVATSAKSIDFKAPYVYLKDLNTGEILLEKNAEEKMAPSSMSKIMTAYLVFERLKSGDVKLDETFHVSENAWGKQGSKTFLPLNAKVSVSDLLQGVIVQSGNDACIALAEGLSGTEAAFAEEATQKAHEMGATNSTFLNATGWPDEGHLTTAKDLAIIAERTIHDFPKEYEKYYSLKEFTFNKIKQGNRNTLLYKNMGADGMKTGHTDAVGYGIVASAKQGDRRLILVINGLPSSKDRDQEATALLNWGFNFFKNYKIFGKGDVVEVADVWSGTEKSVPLVSSKDISYTIPRNLRKDLQVKIVYDSPIAAPLKAGDPVGTLEVSVPEKGVYKIPLHAGKDIKMANFFTRINNSVHYLLWGKHGS
ncbi:MAG TPA: D-alanyl-D-alanine carboxypeptidase family protein [Alphaproteobacteria bacterium]|nr:D-alanyl-D-alanine carboxypeptidase family protein [Alphaproteobacteria bacterium]